MVRDADVAIVGGGVVGLAHAWFALKKGLKVVLFERDHLASGASIRNFGMIWPVGQLPGKGLDWALRSREAWLDISQKTGIWVHENGSLHLAYHADEWATLQEFASMYPSAGYQIQLFSPEEACHVSRVVKREGLLGALWSSTEMTVYSRDAIRHLPTWMRDHLGLIFMPAQAVVEVGPGMVRTPRETWRVDKVVVCSGADFETLFPDEYQKAQFTKCKLHMMKVVPQQGANLGSSLCAGLTLRHYSAFSECPSLSKVSARYDEENMLLRKYGIHILVSQNNQGEWIVGDSHEYGEVVSPFNRSEIDDLIIRYLWNFIDPSIDLAVTERWQGVYPKYNGLVFRSSPVSGVEIVNGLGGAGMTLSMGIAEENVNQW